MEDNIQMGSLNKMQAASQNTVIIPKARKYPQYAVAIIVNLAPFVYGISVGWPSAAIPVLESNTTSPIGSGPITKEDGSWFGGILALGALSALAVYSFISERFGRKIGGILVGIPFVIGWLLTYFGNSVTVLFIARFFIGLSSGGMFIISPMYVSETAEDNVRGALGSFLLLFINFGMLLSYIIGAFVSYHGFAAFGFVFSALYITFFFILPETPVYYITKKRPADARKSLEWLRGPNDDIVEEELARLTKYIKEMQENSAGSVSLKDLVDTRASRMGLLIGLVLCINQQFSGIYAIATYVGNIFAETGSSIKPEIASIIVGLIQLVGSFASSFFMDRAGRRILVIISNVLMSVCLMSIGIYFYMKYNNMDTDSLDWLPVSGLSIYIVAFALGVGPVPFVMISEILPPQTRGLATWICITVLWLLAFLIGKFFITISEAIGIHWCFFFFGTCCVLGAVFDVLVLPETKNKSLDTILAELNG